MPEEIMLVNPRRRGGGRARARARGLRVRPGYVMTNPKRRRRTTGRIAIVANRRRRYRSNPIAIGGRSINVGGFFTKGIALGAVGATAALLLPKMVDKKSRGWRSILGSGLATMGAGAVLGPTAFFGGAVMTALKAIQMLLGKRRGISGAEEDEILGEEEDILGGLESELSAIEGDLSEALGQEDEVWA